MDWKERLEKLKQIPILEVARPYLISNVRRTPGSDLAYAEWPLPTHKKPDKDKRLMFNTRENWWRCYSNSCNRNNDGRKGGDTVNFVASAEGISMADAADKLAERFGIGKAAPHNGTRQPEKLASQPHKDLPDLTSSAGNGKRTNYMHDAALRIDELLCVIVNENDRQRIKNSVMDEIRKSYYNGKNGK